MQILIVEDDPLQAAAIASLIDFSDKHRSAGIADDLESALSIAGGTKIDLALVDIGLKENATGYSVAAELGQKGIPSAFLTGMAPPFDIPELAIGCLTKPFAAEELHMFLTAIEIRLKEGRSTARHVTHNARIYAS